ncbi:Yip1 family protein [Streptomyces sp. B1866]|uniref:Yip1 family protein n=1 Tax=Streptomyces sp. B1866 TaxID=3075431 RepID=UPI002891CAE5|nr:Yip1 family protein [Streptomyces sp. B1866]MDT3397637.1 Yip1 family protein [Streptomyces sp. B1866]
MAGFRSGRGRDAQSARQGQWQGPPQPPPYGHPSPYGGQGPGAPGEPDYFGPGDRRYADPSGQTHPYGVGDAPDAYGPTPSYGPDAPYSPYADDYAPGPGPHGASPPYGPYDGGDPGGYAANTYRAGSSTAPPAAPRLPWKDLLSGIVLRPSATFWQMRDHPMWGPALAVTFVYGLLAVFGLDEARHDVLKAPMSQSIPWVLTTGVAVVLSGLVLGAVTHTLARQLGGDGAWAPTVGLSMLIMSITDAPRLLFAMFLGGDSSFVQVLGWATWVAAGALFTSMVSRSHDLPWPKALGASAIQLVALLALLKLGTL